MIKVVHIAKPVGGVGVYISLLAKHIDENKFSTHLICNKRENSIEVKNLSNLDVETFHVDLIREINVLHDLKILYKIIKIVKEVKPDIIHCHSAKSGILGRLVGAYLRIPTLYTPHAYSYLSTSSKLKKSFYKIIEKIFAHLPSKTIACSKSEYNRAVNELKINPKKVVIWNNSIEGNIQLIPTDLLKKLPKVYICTIGRPSYQKHTELLIDSILKVKKEISTIHLVILGAGLYSPLLEKIKQLIKKNNLEKNITLVPWLERGKTLMVVEKSKLYISSSRYEGLPYAVIEAMALSKPCIVTNVDGNKDLIINDYNGFLVSEDSKKMSDKIIYLLKNEIISAKMSKKTKEEFRSKYYLPKNIKELENIYISALN